jgi:hypothetical protein
VPPRTSGVSRRAWVARGSGRVVQNVVDRLLREIRVDMKMSWPASFGRARTGWGQPVLWAL